jgi:gamma-glutamylcyclotransferase (GGCT)/AIG2-like uncharacterized protein YtfP
MAGRPARDALFAYGSLQWLDVMEAVTGRRFTGCPATLPGHRRRRLVGRSYPGVIADCRESTDGVLFEGLDAEAFAILDLFEGEPYRRVECSVRTEGGRLHPAFVYVIRDEHAALMTDETWDSEAFRDVSLSPFLVQCRAFARDVRRNGRGTLPD